MQHIVTRRQDEFRDLFGILSEEIARFGGLLVVLLALMHRRRPRLALSILQKVEMEIRVFFSVERRGEVGGGWQEERAQLLVIIRGEGQWILRRGRRLNHLPLDAIISWLSQFLKRYRHLFLKIFE